MIESSRARWRWRPRPVDAQGCWGGGRVVRWRASRRRGAGCCGCSRFAWSSSRGRGWSAHGFMGPPFVHSSRFVRTNAPGGFVPRPIRLYGTNGRGPPVLADEDLAASTRPVLEPVPAEVGDRVEMRPSGSGDGDPLLLDEPDESGPDRFGSSLDAGLDRRSWRRRCRRRGIRGCARAAPTPVRWWRRPGTSRAAVTPPSG